MVTIAQHVSASPRHRSTSSLCQSCHPSPSLVLFGSTTWSATVARWDMTFDGRVHLRRGCTGLAHGWFRRVRDDLKTNPRHISCQFWTASKPQETTKGGLFIVRVSPSNKCQTVPLSPSQRPMGLRVSSGRSSKSRPTNVARWFTKSFMSCRGRWGCSHEELRLARLCFAKRPRPCSSSIPGLTRHRACKAQSRPTRFMGYGDD